MARLKRILKWVVVVALMLVAIPVLALLYAWGTYRSVVSAKPGNLDTPAQAGARGAEVNPFIGTGGAPWMSPHNSPGATVPFGMVRLAPDTASLFFREEGNNRSGYFYGDREIIGFSHTRLLGADSLEGGVFRIFPSMGVLGGAEPGQKAYARFSHKEEKAFPGYYAVRLPEEDILAEMTATTRVGVHRYTFPGGGMPQLVIDGTSVIANKRREAGVIRVLPEQREVEGSVRIHGSFSGRYDGLDVYFVARFDRPFASHGVWNGPDYHTDQASAEGDAVGANLSFGPSMDSQTVEVRLAISYVSIVNARANLEAEAADKTFAQIQTEAAEQWEGILSRIQIEGGTEAQRRIFHTALYRAFQMPTTFNDVNGEYTGFDRAVHRVAPGSTYYTDFSLWDSFRTVHPLYNLIARGEQRDMMASLVAMGKAGGALPRWPSGAGYTNCMFGTPADVAVSEAWLKGVRDFDMDAAYAMMRQTAITGKPEGTRFAGREGLTDYLKYGYCPSDLMSDAVSATLEYSWCDHALSLLAKDLGKTEDMAHFAKGAQSYRNLWDPERLFFVPKDSAGEFTDKFDPLVLSYTDSGREYTDDFVEGSAMMWRWGVPFDAEGLVPLFPSREQFVAELEDYFANTNDDVGHWHPGSHYWHGNEPYFHAAYLFNAAGRQDLTQQWVRKILDTKHADNYIGLDGNDDGGTLSAWYVLSALGIYPIAGTTRYEIGTPLFPKATLDLGDGKTLTIVVDNYQPERYLVDSVRINGARLDRWWFDHGEIAEGGEIVFTMKEASGGE